MLKVGDTIKIICMNGEPQYTGKVGTVTRINKDPWDGYQVWGTWGGCCLYENLDTYEIIKPEGQ